MTITSTVRHSVRPFVVLSAVAAAVAVWVIMHPIAGIELAVKMSGGTRAVDLVTVIIASLVANLGAWLLVSLLDQSIGSPRRTWIIVSVAALLVSLIGPLSLATTATAKISLVCIHVVVALTLIPGFTRTLARR